MAHLLAPPPRGRAVRTLSSIVFGAALVGIIVAAWILTLTVSYVIELVALFLGARLVVAAVIREYQGRRGRALLDGAVAIILILFGLKALDHNWVAVPVVLVLGAVLGTTSQWRRRRRGGVITAHRVIDI